MFLNVKANVDLGLVQLSAQGLDHGLGVHDRFPTGAETILFTTESKPALGPN